MGIATKAYLETLIATKLGVPIELKSLSGAALEAFNKLHPRGAEGTRIGGQFVKKVEGVVANAVESVRGTEVSPLGMKKNYSSLKKDPAIIKERDALTPLVADSNVSIAAFFPSSIRPEHMASVRETLKDIYKRTGITKLKGLVFKETIIQQRTPRNSASIDTTLRRLTIHATFPFNDLKGKKRYFELQIDYSKKQIDRLRKMPRSAIGTTPQGAILKHQAMIIESETALKNLQEGKFVREHSIFNIEDKFKALTYHEMGHQWHTDYMPQIDKHFKFKYYQSYNLATKQEEFLCKKYGVTRRATHNWKECIAENFTLYMVGLRKHIHRDMQELFDKYIKEQ